jgi:curli biogenesis system outer membrane secretion channel CsgG
MKKSFLIATFVLCAAALLPLLATAQDKATLAIGPVKATPSLLESVNSKTLAGTVSGAKKEIMQFDTKQELNRVIESLDSQLIDRVNATRKFDVVSRSDLAEVLKEQDLGASGNVDAKAAARAGKVSGAKYLLITTVDDFQDYIEKAVFEGTGQTGHRAQHGAKNRQPLCRRDFSGEGFSEARQHRDHQPRRGRRRGRWGCF